MTILQKMFFFGTNFSSRMIEISQVDFEQKMLAHGDVVGVGWSGDSLLAIARQQWHDDALRVAKQLSRMLLQPLLGHKPLASRALFNR